MPDNSISFKIAYLLREHLELAEQETDVSPVIRETSDRQSLLLMDAASTDARHRRTLEEFFISPQQLRNQIAGRAGISRADLRDEHRRALKSMKIRFGLEIPLALDTDLANHDPAERMSDGTVIHTSYQALHLPSFLPEFPLTDRELNHSWNAAAMITYGAGEFAVNYSTKIIAKEAALWRLQIDLLPKESSVTRDQFTLTLHPAGSCTVTISALDQSYLSARGEFHLLVNGTLAVEDGKREAQLLDYTNKFEWSRVPVIFDAEHVSAIAWKPDAP
ncbi:MAG: hypothetical protein ACTHN5_09605 [Phycisphaerae bacterium]